MKGLNEMFAAQQIPKSSEKDVGEEVVYVFHGRRRVASFLGGRAEGLLRLFFSQTQPIYMTCDGC